MAPLSSLLRRFETDYSPDFLRLTEAEHRYNPGH